MQSVLELQKSGLSLSRALTIHRGPRPWRDGGHEITMQMESQSKPSEVLTNHTIPQTSNHFCCQNTSEAPVPGLAGDALYDLGA